MNILGCESAVHLLWRDVYGWCRMIDMAMMIGLMRARDTWRST